MEIGKSVPLMISGWILNAAGIGLVVGGLVVWSDFAETTEYVNGSKVTTKTYNGVGLILLGIGVAALGAGIPCASVGHYRHARWLEEQSLDKGVVPKRKTARKLKMYSIPFLYVDNETVGANWSLRF